jgi:hypothetical protein
VNEFEGLTAAEMSRRRLAWTPVKSPVKSPDTICQLGFAEKIRVPGTTKLQPVASAAGMLLARTSPALTGTIAGKVFRMPGLRG